MHNLAKFRDIVWIHNLRRLRNATVQHRVVNGETQLWKWCMEIV